MPNSFYSNSLGFTLIELLITISIMAILSAMVFPGFAGFADNQQVQQQTLNVVSDAEISKNKALAGAYSTGSTTKSAYWGIIFCSNSNNDEYTLTAFDDTGSHLTGISTSDTKLVKLQGGVSFNCGTTEKSWVFERLTGAPFLDEGDVKISKGTRARTILLEPSGAISIQ